MRFLSNLFSTLIYSLPAVLIAISMHEFAHGWVSYKMGDPTPKQTGRLSLNPFRHLDPVGTICLLVFHFGWAKPVQVNPWYYKKRKQGMVMVALAGPCMNFLLAFLCTFLTGILWKVTGGHITGLLRYFYLVIQYTAMINTGLGIFNLIPIPPLDGSKVLGAVLPEDKYFHYMQYERFGSVLLMFLLFAGILDRPLAFFGGLFDQFFTMITVFILRI